MDKYGKILYLVLAVIVYMLILKPIFGKEHFDHELPSTFKIDTNMCSPDCCGSQWPISFAIKKDDRIKQSDIGNKYLPTNMTCTGLRGRGCVCADKEQYKFLKNRGNNI
jgi:hypothetical protein